MAAKASALTIYWACLSCGEAGETDKAAEKHTKDTGHPTVTGTKQEWLTGLS